RPSRTSATPCLTFSGVSRLSRPSWSSGPKSPQVEPSGRRFQRGEVVIRSSLQEAACPDFGIKQDGSGEAKPSTCRADAIGGELLIIVSGRCFFAAGIAKPTGFAALSPSYTCRGLPSSKCRAPYTASRSFPAV